MVAACIYKTKYGHTDKMNGLLSRDTREKILQPQKAGEAGGILLCDPS